MLLSSLAKRDAVEIWDDFVSATISNPWPGMKEFGGRRGIRTAVHMAICRSSNIGASAASIVPPVSQRRVRLSILRTDNARACTNHCAK
jgi:hypothetical protein